MSPRPPAHRGQSVIEYALIVAVIALVCIPALSFLRATAAAAYTLHADALSDAPGGPAAATTEAVYVPPTATPEPAAVPYTVPTDRDDCKDGGWRDFNPPSGPFENQGRCISYVNAIPTPTPVPLGDDPDGNPYTVPEALADCAGNGWKDFNPPPPDDPFGNRQECRNYVTADSGEAD